MLLPHCPDLSAVFNQTLNKGTRSICVTAANPGEGVSTVVVDLAYRAAMVGLRTVVVESNMVNPSISAALGAPRAHWAQAPGAIGKILIRHGLGFSVLPAAAASSALAFRDPARLRRILDEELAEFDLVVVDAAPVNAPGVPGLPAEFVAPNCAATILVVLAGVTSQAAVRAAVERLNAAEANLWGAVLNDRFNPRMADGLLAIVDRMAGIAPRTSARIAGWIRRNRILNLSV